MNYKKYIENSIGIILEENNYTKKEYLNYLNTLKKHPNIIIPNEEIIKKIDNKESGAIIEYAISLSGGDSSDINMDEINIFINRINNGYYLIKYIEEIKNK